MMKNLRTRLAAKSELMVRIYSVPISMSRNACAPSELAQNSTQGSHHTLYQSKKSFS